MWVLTVVLGSTWDYDINICHMYVSSFVYMVYEMDASSLLILPMQRSIPIALPYKTPLVLELSLHNEQQPKAKHNPYA